MAPRPPWSVRKDRKSVDEFYVLREGIPDGLMNSLIDFLSVHYTVRYYQVRVERTEHLARITGRSLPRDGQELLTAFSRDEDLLLDAIDHVLAHPDPNIQDPWEAAETVKSYLDDARSVYDIFHVGDWEYKIDYRQPPEITQLVEHATSDGSRSAEHLRRAWLLAFSRDADPNAACVEATKAIEAAARSTIEPNNTRATLGTMIAAMEAKPTKWATDLTSPDLDGVGTVIGMMKAVWKGHLRHGNPSEPLDVPAERCEMIVHSAALLVHWFTSGRMR
ncbi:MAG: hypothetical protein OXM54_12745 [Acidimicrobiaceae bacterium]|nr:hypothetical protein [Acidimicrobiaceae bacterium]